MAHEEEGFLLFIPNLLRFHFLANGDDEAADIFEDLARGARETGLGGFDDTATPAALVEAMDGKAVGRAGEDGEEVVVSVYVVRKAVNED